MTRNSQRVLELLGQQANGLTRADIGERTGLSKPTVQTIVAELRAAGRITDNETAPPSENGAAAGGRPPERFILTPDAGLVVGVDVGHGHIRVAVADRSCRLVGDIQEDDKINVDEVGIPALTRVVELIAEALRSSQSHAAAIRAVVIGIPAAIDNRGTILFSDTLPSWATVKIRDALLRLLLRQFRDLELELEQIHVENDANLGALGEGLHGEAKDAEHYLYVKVSTGIGMGLVLGGELYRGTEGAAGEFGHVTVPSRANPLLRSALDLPTEPCTRCAKLDCLENLASGHAILRQLEVARLRQLEAAGERDLEAAWERDRRIPLFEGKAIVSDRRIEDVVRLAGADAIGHKNQLQAIIDSGTRIGYALADVIRVFAPEVVIVGGLLAEAGDTLLRPIKDAIAGMKGLPAVRVYVVDRERIKRSEVDGAVFRAAELVPSDKGV